jgi:c-di-GMP-binding flagellar brake protein YcgR
MFHDTRPAELDPAGGPDPWAEFRVSHPQERLRLLHQLCEGSTPVILNAPGGIGLTTTLWAVDAAQGRINFGIEPDEPLLDRLVDADETVAVAYLESVKLQFEVEGLVQVRSLRACALQALLPREIYRFQRRSAYRVRTIGRHDPKAHFRHPAMPEMALALRVLDVSIGGCALWQPQDVPPLQAGTRLASVQVELDAETRFGATLVLQHVSSLCPGELSDRGVRLGCEWQPLAAGAERVLQRWIDRTQQRRRTLSLR